MNIKALVVDRKSVESSELTLPLHDAGLHKVVETNAHELAAQPFQPGQYDAVFVEFNTLMESGQALARSLRAMDADVPITRDELLDTIDECVSAASV